MRSAVLILLTILLSLYSYAQEIPVNTEQQLENLADTDQAETEDDSFLQELEYFRKNPLNLIMLRQKS